MEVSKRKVEHVEHVGNGGRRAITKVRRIVFENLGYGIISYQKPEMDLLNPWDVETLQFWFLEVRESSNLKFETIISKKLIKISKLTSDISNLICIIGILSWSSFDKIAQFFIFSNNNLSSFLSPLEFIVLLKIRISQKEENPFDLGLEQSLLKKKIVILLN